MSAPNQAQQEFLDQLLAAGLLIDCGVMGVYGRSAVFEDIIVKSPPPEGAAALKNLNSRDEKDAALKGRFSINPSITNAGRWNALLLDDLFDTGATMEAVCASLKTYGKVGDVYVASITWK